MNANRNEVGKSMRIAKLEFNQCAQIIVSNYSNHILLALIEVQL